MDPIKVDFSKKDGGKKKEIVIPPEKAALKIILSVLCTLVFAAIAFYVMLPAINFKSYDFYLYIGLVAASYVVFNGLFANVMNKPEYLPYVKKRAIVPGIVIAALVVVVGIGYAVSSEFFRAESYSNIIDVRTDSDFSAEIEEQNAESFSAIPKLDEEAAAQLATRALGVLESKGYVSQFTVYPEYTQINYKETPVRVAPLQYANIIKWFTNTRNGFPGYVVIDMANESTEFVETENSIRYSPAEHFGKLLKRHLRFEYPTYMFADATFEIDDNGVPYWICARLDKTIGLFGGTDVIGAVVVRADSETGESAYYTVEEIKNSPELQWLDRIYDSDLLVEQYNFYGKYQNGFWNSILGQRDVITTTANYNYIAKDDDVWMYTGVTSVTSDQSITGFVLVNQRTKEAVYYRVTGGTEYSAQQAAQGRVKDLGYTATFPLLLNIGGEPTYFLSLKDDSNIVQQYALINVAQYNNNKMGATGTDLKKCLESYVAALKGSGIKVDIDTDAVIDPSTNNNDEPAKEALTVSGTIADIRTAVMGGESYYYIKLDSNAAYFSIAASKDETVVILNKGDSVTVTYEDEGAIIDAKSIKLN
ncbi:MAG: CvpA family protein [Clostridia bacterium]|nr:CvpA family protein [Clostridia bacterium]MBQ2694990.1 CvpA family protein [Clostridia bacterium]